MNKGKEIINDVSPRVLLQGDSRRHNPHNVQHTDKTTVQVEDIPVKVLNATPLLSSDAPYIVDKINEVDNNQDMKQSGVPNLHSHVSDSQVNDIFHINVVSGLIHNEENNDNESHLRNLGSSTAHFSQCVVSNSAFDVISPVFNSPFNERV